MSWTEGPRFPFFHSRLMRFVLKSHQIKIRTFIKSLFFLMETINHLVTVRSGIVKKVGRVTVTRCMGNWTLRLWYHSVIAINCCRKIIVLLIITDFLRSCSNLGCQIVKFLILSIIVRKNGLAPMLELHSEHFRHSIVSQTLSAP